MIRIGKTNYVFKRVFHLMLKKDLYFIALESLSKNKGYVVPGMDRMVDDIICNLKNKEFSFKPLCRTYTPKSDGGKCLLSLPGLHDKLVQRVMLMILEAAYEGVFLPSSHGFRKGMSCHSALKDVRTTFSGVKWVMKRDVVKCFDTIDHSTLVGLVRKRISDERFIQLL